MRYRVCLDEGVVRLFRKRMQTAHDLGMQFSAVTLSGVRFELRAKGHEGQAWELKDGVCRVTIDRSKQAEGDCFTVRIGPFRDGAPEPEVSMQRRIAGLLGLVFGEGA